VLKTIARLLLLSGLLLAAACGGDDEDAGTGSITVYSGREEELVAPLFERFTDGTGIEVDVRYGDSAELAATMAEEGDNSPADVFFAQDPGSLGSIEGQLAELPEDILGRVDERFRDGDGKWVGTSGRVRVIAYNTEALSDAEVPDSVFELTDPRWNGKVGIAPTNASFQAFVTAMRETVGDGRTRQWLEDMKANDAQVYESNSPIVEAVASEEIELGLVNHYYLALVKEEQPDAPVANKYLPGDDPGALVSTAGAAVLESSDDREAAERFVDYLLSEEGQRFYAEEAEEAEYPLVDGVQPKEGLPALDSLQGPEVELDSFGQELEATLELLSETGWTT
jgi:iron(III) transport system substrate-binding protein